MHISEWHPFPSTRWSQIRVASEAVDPHRVGALDWLVESYWKPAYFFVRRLGMTPEDAEDLIQDFFAEISKAGSTLLNRADPELGRFRSLLLGAVKRRLAMEERKKQTAKRGGKIMFLSLANRAVELEFQATQVDQLTPDVVYHRRWIQCVLDIAKRRLQDEAEPGRHEILFPHVQGEASGSYTDAAKALGLSEAAVKSAIHRLRKRFHELIRDEVRQTLSDPTEVDEEIRFLLQALAE